MATLNIGGRSVTVDDSFLSLPADQQSATVEEIAASMGGNQKPYRGSFLPLSKDQFGQVSFDSDAGILGAIKRAVTLPGDVVSGKVRLPSSDGSIPGSIGPDEPGANEAIGRVSELAAMGSPVNPAIRAGDRAVPGVIKSLVAEKPKVPTAQQLKAAAKTGYDSARDMGVDYSSNSVKNLAGGIRSDLEKDGIFGELAPKAFSVVSKLENPPEGSIATLANIDAARKSLRRAARDFTNPTEQEAARRIIDGLDSFVTNPPSEAVLAGPAALAGKLVDRARGNYAAAKRSDKITGAVERADLNAAVANSGQNLDNAIRQRMRDILVRPKEAAGYSKEELAQAERVARGTLPANAARFTGNLLGGGGGLGAVVTAGVGAASGSAMGGPLGGVIGAATPAAGYSAKQLANLLTRRQAGKLDEMVRKRSPLFRDALENPVMVPESPEKRAALVRALLLDQQQ